MAKQETSGSLLLAWQVRGRHSLVIGGGEVALSRVHHLIKAGSKITVVSGGNQEGLHDEIKELYDQGLIYLLLQRDYDTDDLTMYEKSKICVEGQDKEFLESLNSHHYEEIHQQIFDEMFAVVCCCIDDYDLSLKIYYQCKYLRLNANIADKPELCDFYFGSMYNRDSLQIMISTNGKSPRLLKMIKDTIAKQLDGIDLTRAVENLGQIRARLREKLVVDNDLVSIDTRMQWIKSLTDFFTLKQWSEVDLGSEKDDHAKTDAIILYFPDFPPKDFDSFKEAIDKKPETA